MADLPGQQVAERGFVLLSLNLGRLVLSRQGSYTIASVPGEMDTRVMVCHDAAAVAPSVWTEPMQSRATNQE